MKVPKVPRSSWNKIKYFPYIVSGRSSPGERNGKFSQNGKFGQNGKLGHSCTNVTKGKLYGSQDSDHAIVHLGLNVSSSAHNCGCVVDGGNAMAAI